MEQYQKERHEPSRDGIRSKEFFFSHKDNKGNRQKGYQGEHVPYRLHEVVKAPLDEVVFFVEGEGKADLLASWGLVATCLDTGAESKWKAAYTPHFKGRHVVIVPDNDKAGEGYGIHSKNIKINFGVLKGFSLDQFSEAFRRYIPATGEISVHSLTSTINNNNISCLTVADNENQNATKTLPARGEAMSRNIWKAPRSDPAKPMFSDEDFWELHNRFAGREEETNTKEKKTCSKQTTTRSYRKKSEKS